MINFICSAKVFHNCLVKSDKVLLNNIHIEISAEEIGATLSDAKYVIEIQSCEFDFRLTNFYFIKKYKLVNSTQKTQIDLSETSDILYYFKDKQYSQGQEIASVQDYINGRTHNLIKTDSGTLNGKNYRLDTRLTLEPVIDPLNTVANFVKI